MAIIQTLVLLVRGIGFINFLLNLIKAFNNETPQTIKYDYNEKLMEKVKKKCDAIRKPNEQSNNTKYHTRYEKIYRQYAEWYNHKANVYWGRPYIVDRYKSSELYVTAGELFEKASSSKPASDCYHFAANQFRELGALRASIEYYKKSSDLSENTSWKIRALQRAWGVAHLAGDVEEEKKIGERLLSLSD